MGKADPDQLLHRLPAIDQENYKSHTQPSGWDEPKFYWISKNIDFEKWHYTKRSDVLWLSGPAECHISDASSCIVDLFKGKPLQTQHLVLYFFCSTASAKTPIAVTFVSTVLYQLACRLPQLKGKVTSVFLHSLLDTILSDEPFSDPGLSRFKKNDSAETTVGKILKASSSEYWRALRAVLGIEQEKELSLIIDGLDKVEHQKDKFIRELYVFIGYLRERRSTARVLLTSRPQAKIKEILGQLPSIEYDRERKGLNLLFILETNKEAKNCRMSE